MPIKVYANRHKSYEIAFRMRPFVSALFSLLKFQISTETVCKSTGYHLIAYVRAWTNALNESVVEKGAQFSFRFNTYIISVLVIFYLQMNQNFPKLADVPPSHTKCMDDVPQNVDKKNLKRSISEFFEFYGKKYELKNQLISVNIGRWQDPQLEIKKTSFTVEQKKYGKRF